MESMHHSTVESTKRNIHVTELDSESNEQKSILDSLNGIPNDEEKGIYHEKEEQEKGKQTNNSVTEGTQSWMNGKNVSAAMQSSLEMKLDDPNLSMSENLFNQSQSEQKDLKKEVEKTDRIAAAKLANETANNESSKVELFVFVLQMIERKAEV